MSYEPDSSGLGGRFYLKLAGACILGGIVFFIVALITLKALFAWGILAVFIVLALLSWVISRVQARRRANAPY